MRYYLYPALILIGLLLGTTFPYYALMLSKWTFAFLFILLSINLFSIDFEPKAALNNDSTDLYFIFFSYFFIPSLVFIIGSALKINYSLKLGFFITSLAPFTIIAPQFLRGVDEKQSAIKNVLISTFLFPAYFSAMMYLFFYQVIKFNIFSIVIDSLILTLLPVVLVYSVKHFYKKPKELLLARVGRYVPLLNMSLIGILSFIFVGSSYLKNNLQAFEMSDWCAIIGLAIFQDFGVFFLSRFLNFSYSQRVVTSMKNVPFVGVFALIFFPHALVSIISILVIHVFLFLYHTFNLQKQLRSAN